ncbi:MAG: helix-turn-helix domain-containing protein [Patescibacteria group bacterium]|nr:helix-turn-helix domain-containing protein [Patescibacteria group bacterium]
MPHTLHYPILKELGLTETEAMVYEVLLEIGPRAVKSLVIPTGLTRGNVYNALNSLQSKGLVTANDQGKVLTYIPTNPENLRKLAENRLTAVQLLSGQLDSVLPGLKSDFNKFNKKPTIRVYEGIEGLKKIYLSVLEAKQPIYSIMSPSQPDEKMLKWLRNTYAPERTKLGLAITGVMNSSERAMGLVATAAQELRSAKVVDTVKYGFKGEVLVFGDCVAFISYKTDDMIGMIVENKMIAETFRTCVRLMHDLLPENVTTTNAKQLDSSSSPTGGQAPQKPDASPMASEDQSKTDLPHSPDSSRN